MNILHDFFTYAFLTRALVVGVLVSLCASLLGVSLVLKRFSMIGDGLSHVGFGALAVGTALGAAPLAVAVPVMVLAAFALLSVNERARLRGDAAIALISSGALAIGIMAVSLRSGTNADVYSYMFGSVLSLSVSDTYISIVLCTVVLVLYILFYNRIFSVTFDESFARATGTRTRLYNMMLALLTAVTVSLGMRMMGTLLISSLIIFPALTAMRVFRSYKSVILCAACVSVFCFLCGMVLSYAMETPTGASIVCVNIAVFSVFCVIGGLRRKRS